MRKRKIKLQRDLVGISRKETMNIGNLYKVKKWYWLLFPTKETPDADVFISSSTTRRSVPASVAWYSKRYNCEVTYFSPDSIIVFLEEDEKFKKVLTSDGKIGWVWLDYESYNDCFEEMKTE